MHICLYLIAFFWDKTQLFWDKQIQGNAVAAASINVMLLQPHGEPDGTTTSSTAVRLRRRCC